MVFPWFWNRGYLCWYCHQPWPWVAESPNHSDLRTESREIYATLLTGVANKGEQQRKPTDLWSHATKMIWNKKQVKWKTHQTQHIETHHVSTHWNTPKEIHVILLLTPVSTWILTVVFCPKSLADWFRLWRLVRSNISTLWSTFP